MRRWSAGAALLIVSGSGLVILNAVGGGPGSEVDVLRRVAQQDPPAVAAPALATATHPAVWEEPGLVGKDGPRSESAEDSTAKAGKEATTAAPAAPDPRPQPADFPLPAGCGSMMCRLLRQLWDLSALPLRTETAIYQHSSQDTENLEHYWDYFNSDGLFRSRGFEIRTGHDGETEYVIVPRTEGPGYIPRVWFTHRQHNWALQDGDDPTSPEATEWGFFGEVGNIRFYFDDEPVPRVDLPLTELFSGKHWPFSAPLVGHYGTANGGNISYLPMPFSSSVLVATTGLPRLFEVEVVRWTDPPDPFPSFRPALGAAESQELSRALQAWTQRGVHPYPAQAGPSSFQRTLTVPGFSTGELVLPGPAALAGLVITLPPGGDERLGMKIFWDGEASPSVEGPLRALFGAAEEMRRYRALPLGIELVGGRNRFYNYFPMPFRREARIVFDNGRPDAAQIPVEIRYRSAGADPGPARFHARFQIQPLEARGDDLGNYVLADLRGSGRYIGCILTMYDVNRHTEPPLPVQWRFPYLESDLNIWVDGKYALPGTGIEDDFDAGYYYIYTDVPGRQWIFPLAGNTWKDERSRGEVTSQYRFYLTNKVEYRESLRVEVEHGFVGNNLSVTYSSTAFWYQDAA